MPVVDSASAEQKPHVLAHLYFIVFAYFGVLHTRREVSHHLGVRSRHDSASVVITVVVELGVVFTGIDAVVEQRLHVIGHNR